jgi:hypothetical protein
MRVGAGRDGAHHIGELELRGPLTARSQAATKRSARNST